MSGPNGMSDELFQRFARMLRDYEAGNFVRSSPGATPSGSTQETVRIIITGNAAGGGRYLAKVLQPPTTDAVETGNVAEADFGTRYTPTAAGSKVLAFNTSEKGLSTHVIAVNTIHNAQIIRRNKANAALAVSFSPGGSAAPTGQIYDVYTVNDMNGQFVPGDVRFK